MLKINHLSKFFHNASAVLDDINLSIPVGVVTGILGPNGAGKTTLISILNGLLNYDSGNIELFDLDFQSHRKQIRSMSSLVPQDYAFYPTLSVSENLFLFAGLRKLTGRQKQNEMDLAIEMTGLQEHLKKPAKHLSGGLKRRLNLAIGFIGNPRILFLDEPTVGIDPQSRHFILESIHQFCRNDRIILYTSHYLEEVDRLCKHIAILHKGRVQLAGPTDDLLSDKKECRITPIMPVPEWKQDRLKKLFDFTIVKEKSMVIADFEDAKLEALVSSLKAEGIPIQSLHYGRRTLEDLFLEKTGLVPGEQDV